MFPIYLGKRILKKNKDTDNVWEEGGGRDEGKGRRRGLPAALDGENFTGKRRKYITHRRREWGKTKEKGRDRQRRMNNIRLEVSLF